MSQPLSQTSLRIRAVLSSIRQRTAARWWYKVGFTVLSICLVGAAKFDSLSEARAAIRHFAPRARSSALTMASDTVFVFGPKQFLTVTSNTQVNYAESFSGLPVSPMQSMSPSGNLPPTQQALYLMRIRHVGGSLTTATVTLNGTQVATAADFTTPTSIERVVTVNTSNANTLGVTLKGVAGAGLVVTIFSGPTSVFDVFGPKVYQKTATTPTHFVESFPLPAEASVPYTISAYPSANNTKATITLNGVQVIKDTDFSGTTPVSRAANLVSGNNSMLVDVRGTTGTTVTVEITANDNTRPVLIITSPTPSLVTNSNSLAVTGTSQDRAPTQVKVNGVAATMSGTGNTQFSATIPLVEGANNIAIQAIDQSGNHTDSTRTVTRDTQTPTLTVTSPVDDSYTNQDAVTVAGTASDASTVTVKVNGVSFPVGQGGAFSGSYTLATGANFLTITATDAGGNVTSQIRKVTQAKQPPVLTVTSPTPGFVKNTTPLAVSGTVTGTTPITVSANGVGLTVTGSSFSGSIPLVQGANDIAITAADPAGNTTVVHRTGSLDTHAPVLTLTAPTNASYSNATTATVSGTASDESSFTVTINGAAVTVAPNGSFSQSVTLVAGANPITVTATDAATNATSLQRTVTQDRTPPTLAVTAPTDGSYSSGTTINVSGTASDATPLTVKVNGSPATVNPDGSFTYSAALAPGTNTLSVVATDAANNSTTVSRTVVQDIVPPTFEMNIPAIDSSGPVTNAENVVVIITATDESPVTVTVNSVPLAVDANGKYTVLLPLSEGWNYVSASVTDAAGNSNGYVQGILRDTQPPVVTLTSPADGAQFSTEPVIVGGTINDSNDITNIFTLTVNGASVSPDCSDIGVCSFSTPVHLATGSNTITVVVRERAGNTATVTRTVTFSGVVEGVPPDPATVAPALDATVATTTFAATSFLYTGPNPIQTGVATGTIQPLRSAVIRGNVLTRAGDALAAVKVSVLDHPEFGQTLSRADGYFDLVVNGGGLLTLNYEKSGFLPAQRQVNAAWQEYSQADLVTLVSLDPVVTTVDFSQPAQAAQGSVVTDESGTRRATMIFKGGTHASLAMPDGTIQPLSSIAVRATEYTVGPSGPSAMPAPLPATSGYTYAVELSADETIAAGATGIVFDQPVAVYVDNFLHFPIGTAAPVGSYDRAKAQWLASPNGRVVKILQITNGRASLDVDGSGTEATPAELAVLGVNEAELTRLGSLYAPDKSFWRVQFSHFSPKDINWAFRVDSSSKPPKRKNPDNNKAKDKDCPKVSGSIIGCERQTLGESIAIAGTSLRLNYQSDGTPGYKEAYSKDISLIGDTVPTNLRRIEVEVRIAGRLFKQTFSSQPNQTLHFVWDGKDAYGRSVQGTQTALIRIGYTYPPSSWDEAEVAYPNSNGDFGAYGDSPLTGDQARVELTLWQEIASSFGTRDTRSEGLGGWSLGIHHSYDPVTKVLHLGDGTTRSAAQLPNATTTVASTDCAAFNDFGHCARHPNPGDRALDVFLGAQGMGVASDGTMYLADGDSFKIWRVNSGGTLELIAGNGTNVFNGDGIPATSAGIYPEGQLRVGPDNSVYFIDYTGDGRIRRVDKNGIITTAAGTGVCGDSVVTGIPATQADLCVYNFTLAKDGTLFILDGTEVYRVGADGIITRIVGDGTYARCSSAAPSYTCAEGKQANAHGVFNSLHGVAVGPDGSLYLANGEDFGFSGTVIYRIGPDGTIRRVAGDGNWVATFLDRGNGGPAIDAGIPSYFVEPAIGPDGTLYFVSGDGYLTHVDHTGVLTLMAGCIPFPAPVRCVREGGERTTLTSLSFLSALDFGPDGRLYILDNFARRIDTPLPSVATSDVSVASEDGSELYVFNAAGRHLSTVDARLGNTVHAFEYDAAGLLSKITDVEGNVVRVERDGTGVFTAITAPFGQRTQFTLNPSKYLATVTRPGEPAMALSYSADGLLQTLTDGNGNVHQFAYDENGLLVRDDDPAGGFKTLVRTTTDSSSAVTLTTALGNAVFHSVTNLSTGATRRTAKDGPGLASGALTEINGTVTLTAADGTITTVSTGADVRFGMQAPTLSRVTTVTPDGLFATVTDRHSAILSDGANPLSLESQVDSLTVNGRLFLTSYAASTRTLTATTPAGRSSTTRQDSLGRVAEETTQGITPVQFQYDARGRLAQIVQGSRQWSYAYDANGRLATATDPLTRSSQYSYDSAGRLTREVQTDGGAATYAYDGIGNLRSLAPPGRPAHQFQHNSVNLLTSYDPPSLGAGIWSTTYQYDLDRRLTRVVRPDSQTIAFGYDSAGRQSTVIVPGGAVNYGYSTSTGNLATVSGPYGGSLSFSYDGSLLKGATWTGEVTGMVSATYNSDFQIASLGVNGGSTVDYSYDGDGLPNQVGALTVFRAPTNGLITGTALGAVTTSQSYLTTAELDRSTAIASGTTLFDVSYSRDASGRIAGLTEVVSGVTTIKGYVYDLGGRLTEVRENGALTAVYEYDTNGNRVRVTRPAGVENATYDDQDRLLAYGPASYTHTRNGELNTKTVGSQVTRYEYDVLRNLRRVELPDGTVIEYVADGMGRRVGRKVNGVLVQGLLYQGRLTPIAELDGAGNIVSQFVYGTGHTVPDYMVKGGSVYRVLSDHLGSVRMVVEASTGAVVQRLDYDEFGKITMNSNPGFQPFGFAGGLYDDATRLTRFGARDYSSDDGRWTTKEPLGIPGAGSVYGYVGADPINLSDPSGLCEDASGASRPCRVTISPEASQIGKGASLDDLAPGMLGALQEIADQADLDLGINAIRNGTHQDTRHGTGYAVDIGYLDGKDIGFGATTNEGMLELALRVQAAAACLFGGDGLHSNLGPGGKYLGKDGPFPINTPSVRRAHRNHIHLSFDSVP